MKLFNTFNGVFVPSYEAILGAVLFLILPALVAGMGLWNMLIIVVLANTVTLATAFSIADCATNLNKVGGGGMYAVSKRSLGMAFGGSIGIQLYLAQALSIGFYAIGFAKALQPMLINISFYADLVNRFGWSMLQQYRYLGLVIAGLAFTAGIVGADFVVKIQMVIFVILSVAVGSILLSPFLDLSHDGQAIFSSFPNLKGIGWQRVMGYMGFWMAFTTFFPAVTGIDAGVGMSGNLKDPRKSLAKGTFIAIAVTTVVYLLVTVVFGFVRPQLLKVVLVNGHEIVPTAMDIFKYSSLVYAILLVGILFATGSSALSYFMTSPRTCQALARDRILPRFLNFLGHDFKRGGAEPRWATVLTFLILIPVIWPGDVAFASRVVGISFLVVYGWINLAAFLERVSGNPSFRPTSRGHWAISLYGFLLCMAVIAMDNLLIGLGVFISQAVIFYLLLKFKSKNRLEGVWWGVLFSWINWGFKRMQRIIQGTKNWRPIMGVFCFADKKEESLTTLEMGNKISEYKGLTMVNVLKPAKILAPLFKLPKEAKLVSAVNDNFETTIESIAQAAVPGGFAMNTVLLPMDNRINQISLIENIMQKGLNVLLYKHGELADTTDNRIDVWWKGEENGNLMALLSYIIVQSDLQRGKKKSQIRLIRRLDSENDTDAARAEMGELMTRARLGGEVLILSNNGKTIHETIREQSQGASLILIGMPGKRAGGIARIFSLDKLFFTKEMEKFSNFPPILFVKAGEVMNLFE